jgi:hypothetical protein
MLRFRIPIKIWAAFMGFNSLLALPLFFWAKHVAPLTIGPFLVLVGVAMLSSLFISEIRVLPRGLVVNRVKHLQWVDVIEARRRSAFGLPHLFITRRRGIHWWVPLYYRGPVDLEDAIRRSAPEDNPIARALAPV